MILFSYIERKTGADLERWGFNLINFFLILWLKKKKLSQCAVKKQINLWLEPV